MHRFWFCLLLVLLIARTPIQIASLIALEVSAIVLRILLRVHHSKTELIFSLFESICFIGYLSLFGGLLHAQEEHDYGWNLEYSYLMVVAILCSVAISIGFPVFSLLRDLACTLRYTRFKCPGCRRCQLGRTKCCPLRRLLKGNAVSRVSSSRVRPLSLGLGRAASLSRNPKREPAESEESPVMKLGTIQRRELIRFRMRQRSITDCLETVSPRTDVGLSPRNFSRGLSSSRGFVAMASEADTPRSQLNDPFINPYHLKPIKFN